MKSKVLFVVKHSNGSFADKYHHDGERGASILNTKKEHVQIVLDQYVSLPPDSEHYDYWMKQKAMLVGYRETTILEEDLDSTLDYTAVRDFLSAWDRLEDVLATTGIGDTQFIEEYHDALQLMEKAVKKAEGK